MPEKIKGWLMIMLIFGIISSALLLIILSKDFFYKPNQEKLDIKVVVDGDIELVPGKEFDPSGRDVVYIKSSIVNRVDFTSGLGWKINSDGIKKDFVGIIKSINIESDTLRLELYSTADKTGKIENFVYSISPSIKLNLVNLSDSELKIYEVNTFMEILSDNLTVIFHKDDVVHVSLQIEPKTNTLIQKGGKMPIEMITIRRFGGINELLSELNKNE